MKKILLMVAVAIMTATSVNAQTAGKWSFKGRAGFNMSTVTNDDDAKWKFGLSLSSGVDYMLSDQMAVSLELDRNSLGSKSDMLDVNSTLDYIHVPLLAKFYLKPWLALEAGPQIGFLVSAKQDGVSFKDTCKKTEFSIPVGLSFEIPARKSDWYNCVVVDLRYHLGLTKVNDYGTDSYCNRAIILTLGYKFGL